MMTTKNLGDILKNWFADLHRLDTGLGNGGLGPTACNLAVPERVSRSIDGTQMATYSVETFRYFHSNEGLLLGEHYHPRWESFLLGHRTLYPADN